LRHFSRSVSVLFTLKTTCLRMMDGWDGWLCILHMHIAYNSLISLFLEWTEVHISYICICICICISIYSLLWI
jgi:hypothetical protein